MGAVGAMVVPDVTAVFEGALTLVRDGASCIACEDDRQHTRSFVGAGLRGAWGWGTLAGHVGYGLDDDPDLTLRPPVTIDVTVGARW
jgi:diadenosine tetraphosphatase ApaH/serine/threonine PP2A family protein phosphatase